MRQSALLFANLGGSSINLRHSLRSVLVVQKAHGAGAGKTLSASSEPSNDADKANDTNGSTSVVHRLLIDGVSTWEVERDRGKEKENEPQKVETDRHWGGK